MPLTPSLPDLHDWSLICVSYDWEHATAALTFCWNGMEKRVVGRGTNEFSLSQLEPWGQSISVNRVAGPEIGTDGIGILKIEMQSGDVITLRATSIELQ
jgi:hypothetical protein